MPIDPKTIEENLEKRLMQLGWLRNGQQRPQQLHEDNPYAPHSWLSPGEPKFKILNILTGMLLPLLHKKTPTKSASRIPPLFNPASNLGSTLNGGRTVWHALEAHSHQSDIKQLNPETRVLIQYFLYVLKNPYKVGATLYLLQQMYDRTLDTEPSLPKAFWVFACAPLTEDAGEPPRENPWGYSRFWKNHHNAASEWAAFVTLTKTPLVHDSDVLHRFLQQDPVEFEQLTEKFKRFRYRVKIPRTSKDDESGRYLKLDLNEFPPAELAHLKNEGPELGIPNILSSHQWQTVQSYTSKRDSVKEIREKKKAINK